MNWLIHVLIGNSVVAAAIAAVALLALLCRRPAVAHVLWVLVLVKLVTPPIVRVPVEAPWATSVAQMPLTESDPQAAELPASFASETASPEATHVDRGHPLQPAEIKPNPFVAWCASHAGTMLIAVWAAGTLSCVGRAVVQTRRLARMLEGCDAADAPLLAQVRDVASRIGLAAPPNVRIVAAAVSPMVVATGTTSSCLILPASLLTRLDCDELRAVLAHELAHLRRRDHWVRWLEAGATALLWWHPLLWLARRGLHEAEEQCCDAWVVWALPECRRAYAYALVTTAGLLADAPDAPIAPGASGLGQFHQLKRRLVMIMHGQTTHALSSTGKWLLAAGIMLALPVLPAIVENGESSTALAAPSAAPSEPKVAKTAPKALAGDAGKADADKGDKKEEAPEDQAGAQAPREQIDAEKAKARARMRQDGREYSSKDIEDAEALYQVANKQWRSPEAKASLEKMVKEYPKLNRTGCAILYLGQYSEGEEREKYLSQAVKDFSDCFYGNGVQVGAFARYLLGHYYIENGDPEKGRGLLEEIVKDFPNSVTHRGDALAKVAKEDLEAPPKKSAKAGK